MINADNNIYSPAGSIEDGYFIFTLMPSLACSLNCPHCYLSKEQRKDKSLLSHDSLLSICKNIDSYYSGKNIKNKTIVNYWYGGEPTEMGIDYTKKAVELINSCFTSEKGYASKHIFLSSLVTVDNDLWFPFFSKYSNSYVQTSFDGLMRGKGYLYKWERQVKAAIEYGLNVATISVVNQELIKVKPYELLEYLTMLNIKEASFLPFMLNIQNQGEKYETYSVGMSKYSQYMIELTKAYYELKKKGKQPPEIGQYRFIVEQFKSPILSNIAAQTLFLLPNGDLSLPDYINGNKEYLNIFGNALDMQFDEILCSKARRHYLRKQVRRNNNSECQTCDYAECCIMEFWKTNNIAEDCYGASKFVQWTIDNISQDVISTSRSMLV